MANIITDIGKAVDEPKDEKLEGFVRFQYMINNLRANGRNATINLQQISDRGFSIIVSGNDNGDLANQVFNPRINQLPYEIVPAECYFNTPKNNFLFVYLKKADTSQSWEYEIMNDLLETAEG